jgi:hypothetical protein
LSYRLCYHFDMAQREKRSVSLPPELARAIDEAAAAWEAEHGPLFENELAEGLARARELLGRSKSKQSA